jgi:uncharacterized membrane protein
MELVLNQTKVISKAVLKELTMALAIAVGYFTLCAINPFQSFTAITSLSALTNIRIADVLRAKAISSIGAATGVAFGAHAYNIYTGKVLLGAYPIMPMIILGIWITAHLVSERIGKSVKKDLLVIGIAGLLTGFVVTFHLTSLAMLLHSDLSKLLTIGAMWKMVNHAIVPMVGYLVFKGLRK